MENKFKIGECISVDCSNEKRNITKYKFGGKNPLNIAIGENIVDKISKLEEEIRKLKIENKRYLTYLKMRGYGES